MKPRNFFILKVGTMAVLVFITAAAFSAYLKPGMLVEFANLVLCN